MDALHLLQGNIIDLLGLQSLPVDRQQKLIEQMGQVLQDRVIDALVAAMTEEQRTAFEQFLQSNPTAAQLDEFFKKHLPTYLDIVMEEAAKFKKELVNEVATVRQIVASAS